MLRLIERLGPEADQTPDDTLTLPYELRIRGRLRATTDKGVDVGLFLDRGPVLRDGDRLRADSGEIIQIKAADEPVVTARIASGLPLARLCYHLGNRHVSLAIGHDDADSGWVRFPPDHVLAEMAELLGATVSQHRAPFDPEPGAYALTGIAHSHSHSHGDGEAHSHASESHSHSHSHSHQHDGAHGHEHHDHGF